MMRSKFSPSQSSSSSKVIGWWPEISWPSSAIAATANGSSSPLRTPADFTYSAFGNMCCSRLSDIGERTLFRPHANSTACGARGREGASTWLNFFRLGHDLFEQPLHTFSGHALPFPVQHADQREQPAGGFEIDPHLALQALLQRARAFVVDAAAAHVDGLDLVRGRSADRLIIAVANHEIVFHDSPERRQRQQVRHHG